MIERKGMHRDVEDYMFMYCMSENGLMVELLELERKIFATR